MENNQHIAHVPWLQQLGLSEGLIAALIVGLLGLCGVLATQYFDRKKERKIFLRKKFEELFFRLIDFSSVVKEEKALGKGNTSFDISDFAKEGGRIEVLTVLYFPELESDCKLFLECGLRLCAAQLFVENNADEHNIDSLEEMEKNFNDIYDRFYKKLKSCMKKYT